MLKLVVLVALLVPMSARAQDETKLRRCLLQIEDIATRLLAELDHGDWVRQEYRLLHGTFSISTAQIVFLGDTHDDAYHQRLNRRFVERFARPGDWLLVEGAPYTRRYDGSRLRFTRGLGTPLTIRGWEENGEFRDAIEQIRDLVVLLTTPGTHVSDPELDERLQAIDESARQRRNPVLRRSLQKAMEAVAGTTHRIFVTAGSKHLESHAELRGMLRGTPCALLVPKRSTPARTADTVDWIQRLTGVDLTEFLGER